MKRLYKKSLYKIFVSLFVVFYSFVPQVLAIDEVITELQETNSVPIEEEIIPEESLSQEEVVLPEEEVPPVVEEPLVEEPITVIEDPAIEDPVVEEPIIEPEEVIREVMSYPVWVINGDTATTYEVVELGKTYIAPQNSRVRIIFTKLPENPSKLTVEEITLTQEEIDATGAVSDKAYDITTDMLDGTFEYDLILPYIEEDTKIVYVEERADLLTDVKEVTNSIVKDGDTLKIEDLDHFTIYFNVEGEGWICQEDAQGANDEPGQKDLNLMCSNSTYLPSSFQTQWNWDEISWTGANTGDACNLFDTDNDSFANFSLCVRVSGTPASWQDTVLYSCTSDSRADRCVGSVLITSFLSDCDASVQEDDPFAGVGKQKGDNYPFDTVGSCDIDMSDFGTTGARLLDVCSFPSGQPGSDPSDCIITPTDNDTGTIEIIKMVNPSTDTGKFNLQIDEMTYKVDAMNNDSTGAIELSTGSHTIQEANGTSTNLINYTSVINCVNSSDISQGTLNSSGPLEISLEKNEAITCTIINTLQNPALTIVKSVTETIYDEVGDVLHYSYLVTNSGNVSLTGPVVISDDKTTNASCPAVNTVGNLDGELDPGESITCTSSYTIVLADLNAGSLTNYAYATADGTTSNTDDETVNSVAGKITIQKAVLSFETEQLFEFTPSWTESFYLSSGEEEVSDWLVPSMYTISEVGMDGWRLKSVLCSDPQENNVGDNIMLGENEMEICLFTNEVISSQLEITKDNDSPIEGLLTGSTVMYTLTIEAPNDEDEEGTYLINNVKVTDILPEGFGYVAGSWTATSSIRGNIKGSTTTEPIYNGVPAVWKLGNMVEGEIVTLTYVARINLLNEPGTYKDIAYVQGDSLLAETDTGDILGISYDPSEYLHTDKLGVNFIGTNVLVIEPIEDGGEVLGASITLPATGTDTYITLGALISMILGILLFVFGKKRKLNTILLSTVLLFGIFTLVKPMQTYAQELTTQVSIRLEEPKTGVTDREFDITYVALSIPIETITVQCQYSTDGVNFTNFDTPKTTNSGNCKVTESIITGSGTYYFRAVATVEGVPSVESEKVSVNITNTPLPVTDYSKTEGTCTYTLKFKSTTSKVQIFRSDNQKSFYADDTTLITKPSLTVTPNILETYTDTSITDCSKEYYYAIRTLDDYNNVSTLVTDDIVTIVTVPSTTTTTVTVNGETGEVAGEETTAREETEGENGTGAEDGDVKGDEEIVVDDSEENKDKSIESIWNKYKYVIIAAGVVVLGSAGYSYVRRKK